MFAGVRPGLILITDNSGETKRPGSPDLLWLPIVALHKADFFFSFCLCIVFVGFVGLRGGKL